MVATVGLQHPKNDRVLAQECLAKRLSLVGSSWLSLQRRGIVNDDELYRQSDWYHPSLLGSFATALALIRDSLNVNILDNKYFPPDIDLKKAKLIQKALAEE